MDDTLDGDAIIVYDYGTLKKTSNSLMFRVPAQKRDERRFRKKDQKGSEMTTYVIFINYL